ncbi:amidohydrolase family protein [Microtetraspora sp. NBRC 16547]|uniref:amidohydrolase family protein n=1 Tax=Microtetraspora sp. NBRC 16547 TaxID=3030993 RepID=UPI0024A51B9F|nr:amidohydrolase family protein [Microtetraspora sp. NBRC 16547]GLX02656.1 amidohydrolase [Microtetraspora sp. NBRC 16547]
MTITASEQQVAKGKYALPFDCDNHYYEKIDAFIRHLDPAFKHRGIQVVKQGTHTQLLAGGRLFEFVPNPTFDPVIVPGCQDLLFRGQIPEGVDPRSLMKVEPLNPAYQNRDLRLEMIDQQGLSGVLLFPTLACGVEEALHDDVGATMASITAFNTWLDEDWGYSYKDRIMAAPMLSFADPDEAVKEIDRLVTRNVRIVSVRPAPVPMGRGQSRSFGHPDYDKVWAKLEEHDIPVGFHLSDSGYNRFTAFWGGPERFVPFRNPSPLGQVIVADRAIHDTLASLIIEGVFTRHPKLRVASIENGSDWVYLLIKRLRKQANQTPRVFAEDPADTIRKHLWVAPYYEEDIRKLADTVGADRVLFGSDWPHGEGLANPTDFVHELKGFTESEIDQVMRTNVVNLLGIDH